jgi:hypothetical protein
MNFSFRVLALLPELPAVAVAVAVAMDGVLALSDSVLRSVAAAVVVEVEETPVVPSGTRPLPSACMVSTIILSRSMIE